MPVETVCSTKIMSNFTIKGSLQSDFILAKFCCRPPHLHQVSADCEQPYLRNGMKDSVCGVMRHESEMWRIWPLGCPAIAKTGGQGRASLGTGFIWRKAPFYIHCRLVSSYICTEEWYTITCLWIHTFKKLRFCTTEGNRRIHVTTISFCIDKVGQINQK